MRWRKGECGEEKTRKEKKKEVEKKERKKKENRKKVRKKARKKKDKKSVLASLARGIWPFQAKSVIL